MRKNTLLPWFIITLLLYGLTWFYPFERDVNQGNKLALSGVTQSLLQKITKPVQITLMTNQASLFHEVKHWIKRYQLVNPNIQFEWLKNETTETAPIDKLILKSDDRTFTVNLPDKALSEATITQALFALHRKMNSWVVFLQGHEEGSAFENAPKDFSLLRVALENQGIKIQRLQLRETPFIPENTQLLVIAARSALMPMEEKVVMEYIAKGGDVLWMLDPQMPKPARLMEYLGIERADQILLDPYGQQLGTPNPAIVIVDNYPPLPFTPPPSLTAFPYSSALKVIGGNKFSTQPLLLTHDKTVIGLGLTRELGEKIQRISVIGNSRFLTNGVISNYGNLGLGLNLINWLSHADALMHIEQPVSEQSLLTVHFVTAWCVQYLFPLLPLLLGAVTVWVHFARVRRSNRVMAGLPGF